MDITSTVDAYLELRDVPEDGASVAELAGWDSHQMHASLVDALR
jgi:hypothetical protein